MLAATQDVDPVALYTADELYDLDDADVLSRRRVSPAVYQELQARVRRAHRAFGGLVRAVHPRTGDVVDAIYVQVPAPPVVPTPEDVEAVAAALTSSAQRFLGAAPGETALAELRTWNGLSIFVEYDARAGVEASCWTAGELVRQGSLTEALSGWS